MVAGWYPGRPVCFALTPSKPRESSCNPSTKNINYSGWIIFSDKIIQRLREQGRLMSALTFNVIRHICNRVLSGIFVILIDKIGFSMGISIMVDHIKLPLRLKSDQQFSHSLGTKRTVITSEFRIPLVNPIFQSRRRMYCSLSINPLLLTLRTEKS